MENYDSVDTRTTYSLNEQYHRTDSPAVILYKNGKIYSETYFINGQYHRTDGPACIIYNEAGNVVDERYCLINSTVTKEQFYTPGFIDSYILENS